MRRWRCGWRSSRAGRARWATPAWAPSPRRSHGSTRRRGPPPTSPDFRRPYIATGSRRYDMRCERFAVLALVLLRLPVPAAAGVKFTVRSAQSGKWSDAATWTPKRVPGAGDLVQVRPGHRVTYDVASDKSIRMIHVTGTLTFSRERSTRLDVGLIKVQ